MPLQTDSGSILYRMAIIMAAMGTKSEAFFNAINEASEEHKTAITREVDLYKAEELASAKAEADRMYNEYVASETTKLTSMDGVDIAKRSDELRRSVMQTRTDITDRVFSKVEEKLNEFTCTPEYKSFLVNSAKKMAEKCGECSFIIYMREKDLAYSDDIKAVSEKISEIRTDNSITLGGIYCICDEKSIKLNDLLSTRLEAQKDGFYLNSGLTL